MDEAAAGGVDITNLDDKTSSWQKLKIKDYFMHPSYTPANKKNDICLLILEQPFTFNEYVKPIELEVDNLDAEANCSTYIRLGQYRYW